MPRGGSGRGAGSGDGEAGAADAEVREAFEVRELQGEAGAADVDREFDRRRSDVRRGSSEELGSGAGSVPEQRGLGGEEGRGGGAGEVGRRGEVRLGGIQIWLFENFRESKIR